MWSNEPSLKGSVTLEKYEIFMSRNVESSQIGIRSNYVLNCEESFEVEDVLRCNVFHSVNSLYFMN